MGNYVALQLRKSHPGIMGKIIKLATKFHWDLQTAKRECALLQWENIEAKLPQFAEVLAKRHAPVDWKELMEATADMLRAMGDDAPLETRRLPQPEHANSTAAWRPG